MKRIIRNIFCCVLLSLIVSSCEEGAALLNPDVSHGKSTVTEGTAVKLGYLNSATVPNSDIVELRIGDPDLGGGDEDDLGIEDGVYVVLPKPAEKDLILTIAMDKQYAEGGEYAVQYAKTFSETHNIVATIHDKDSAPLVNKLLVAGHHEATVTIKAGEQQSGKIKLLFLRENLNSRAAHLFPVSAIDVETGESYGKIDYLIKTSEKTVRDGKEFVVAAYVDTEVMNPLIADQFIIEEQKYYDSSRETYLYCPAIDITNVRTAFLKDINGRAMLTYTNDMEYVLKHAARYLQPMQQNGMKVCLTIKGGGTGLGFANLSDTQISDFAAQVQTAVALYHLDGVNLWDEGAGYGKEGIALPNKTSYAKLIKALKVIMPDKLLTLVDTRETTEALCEEQDGIRVGDYLDYAWSTLSDVLNPYAADTDLKPLAGLSMEKYASFFIPEMEDLSDDEENELVDKLMIFVDGMTTVGKRVFVLGDLPYMDYGKENVWTGTISYIQMFLFDMNPDPDIMGDGSYTWYSNCYAPGLDYYSYRKDW